MARRDPRLAEYLVKFILLDPAPEALPHTIPALVDEAEKLVAVCRKKSTKKLMALMSIREKLAALWDYEKLGTPFRRGDRYYFYRNSGLQNQYVLYVQDSLDGKPRVLMDPNTWSEDGTVALSGTSFSCGQLY